jgi:hypothetical protein
MGKQEFFNYRSVSMSSLLQLVKEYKRLLLKTGKEQAAMTNTERKKGHGQTVKEKL